MSNSQKTRSFGRFLKQNLALVIIITCAIAVCALVLVLNATNKPPALPVDQIDNNNDDTGIIDNPIVIPPTQKSYVAPVAEYTVGMDYSRDSDFVLVYKKTLNEYSVHNGIDFLAEAGTDVVAIFDGQVTAVSNDFGMGHTVEITHADGQVSRYMSLGEDVCVTLGQQVEGGQKIGTVGTTAANESLEGAHVHLEILKDNQYVNPRTVIQNID